MPFHLGSDITDTAAKSTLIYQLSIVITFFSTTKNIQRKAKCAW